MTTEQDSQVPALNPEATIDQTQSETIEPGSYHEVAPEGYVEVAGPRKTWDEKVNLGSTVTYADQLFAEHPTAIFVLSESTKGNSTVGFYRAFDKAPEVVEKPTIKERFGAFVTGILHR